jgi:hypothetical protein
VEYFTNKTDRNKLTGLSFIAMKYDRLCPGNPVTRREFEADDTLQKVLPFIDQRKRIIKITDKAGKQIEWLLKGKTTMIDLTYCQT